MRYYLRLDKDGSAEPETAPYAYTSNGQLLEWTDEEFDKLEELANKLVDEHQAKAAYIVTGVVTKAVVMTKSGWKSESQPEMVSDPTTLPWVN